MVLSDIGIKKMVKLEIITSYAGFWRGKYSLGLLSPPFLCLYFNWIPIQYRHDVKADIMSLCNDSFEPRTRSDVRTRDVRIRCRIQESNRIEKR